MQSIPENNLHLVRAALADFPRPDSLAESVLTEWLSAKDVNISANDIDIVTLRYQSDPSAQKPAGHPNQALIRQKMTLVEAMLGNWQGETAAGYEGFHYGDWAGIEPDGVLTIVSQLEPPAALSNTSGYLVFNGLYRRTQPQVYSAQTRVDIRAEDFQTFIWKQHFHHLYKHSLDTYWKKSQALYQRAVKINFIAAANHQAFAGTLSLAGRMMVWQAAGLVSIDMQPLKASMLNVYGYHSTSMVLLERESGHCVLYVPGNASPLHEFSSLAVMKTWFAEQCRDSRRREALLHMFSPADWPDGLDFSGLRTALAGLGLFPEPHRFSPNHPGFATSGVWDPQHMIDYKSDKYLEPITSDLFEYLTLRHLQRSYEDADALITSNHEIDKSRWSSYLNAAVTLLLPVCMVLPELTPLLAVGGLIQFSLGMDKTVNGKTLDIRTAGVNEQVFGLFNASQLLGSIAARPDMLFRYCRPGFVASTRITELVGSAVQPPEVNLLPAETAFREDVVVSSTLVSALVARIDENLGHRFAAWISEDGRVTSEWVEYDYVNDCFIRISDQDLSEPPRWIVSEHSTSALARLAQTDRTVTDEQRMATLRALGIDLRLPVDFDQYERLVRTPIERLISSVWVGDRVIQPEYLAALEHNSTVLKGSGFRYQLLLSGQSSGIYQQNINLLRARAHGLKVLNLEEQGFFTEFKASPYYPQYQAAIIGNGRGASNFSSATDILRYRLLKHYGGIYMDADDRLLAASAPSQPPLASAPLSTTTDGLLLAAPVSNDQLGMYIKYNISLIGSHAGNPTLDAISDEILKRYGSAGDFYLQRPDYLDDPVGFDAYARRLSQLTGPGVFNDVIDQHLPWLKQLRELCVLLVSPVHDINSAMDLSAFSRAIRNNVPLDQVAEMGHANSWKFT